MKAEELRIGNFIYNDRNEIFKVNWITEIIESRQSTAIPLTEEWLLKFGFERWAIKAWAIKGWAIKGKISIYKQDGVFWYIAHSGNEVCLEYVHQLQNLYFALTGEELKYELE
jgi:hypothetical protein